MYQILFESGGRSIEIGGLKVENLGNRNELVFF